jgi:hypothetical protein
MMHHDDILILFQERHAAGASSHGQSFYRDAAECGRRSNLARKEREQRTEPPPPPDKLDKFAIGTAYHMFHEIAWTKSLDSVLDLRAEALNVNLVEGHRLFKGWRELWGSPEKKYGCKIIDAEAPVATEVDGEPYTGRLDLRIETTGPADPRIGFVLSRGHHILDWKTAAGASDGHAMQFTQGLQGAGYLFVDGDEQSVVYDVLYKVKVFRHEPMYASTGKLMAGVSYAHYQQIRDETDYPRLQGLVKLGARNAKEDLVNPAACLYPHVCKFYAICRGVQ